MGNALSYQLYLWPTWICGTIYLEGEEITTSTEHTWPVEKDFQIVSDTDVEVKYSFKVNLVSSSANFINALEKNILM